MRLWHKIWRRRAFRIPAFDLSPFEFEPDRDSDMLALDEIAAGLEAEAPVIRLVHPAPSASELHESIERHLRAPNDRQDDAAEELRSALAELRQSLG